MARPTLKSRTPAAGAPQPLPPIEPEDRAAAAMAVVEQVARPGLPPAVAVETGPANVQVNFKVRQQTADALADAANARGVSQKVLVCRALDAYGIRVSSADLTERPVPKRRGSAVRD